MPDLHQEGLAGDMLIVPPRLDPDGPCELLVFPGELFIDLQSQGIVDLIVGLDGEARACLALARTYDKHEPGAPLAVHRGVVGVYLPLLEGVGVPVYVYEQLNAGILFVIRLDGFDGALLGGAQPGRLVVGRILDDADAVLVTQ